MTMRGAHEVGERIVRCDLAGDEWGDKLALECGCMGNRTARSALCLADLQQNVGTNGPSYHFGTVWSPSGLSCSSQGVGMASIAVTTQYRHHQTAHKQYKKSYTLFQPILDAAFADYVKQTGIAG